MVVCVTMIFVDLVLQSRVRIYVDPTSSEDSPIGLVQHHLSSSPLCLTCKYSGRTLRVGLRTFHLASSFINTGRSTFAARASSFCSLTLDHWGPRRRVRPVQLTFCALRICDHASHFFAFSSLFADSCKFGRPRMTVADDATVHSVADSGFRLSAEESYG